MLGLVRGENSGLLKHISHCNEPFLPQLDPSGAGRCVSGTIVLCWPRVQLHAVYNCIWLLICIVLSVIKLAVTLSREAVVEDNLGIAIKNMDMDIFCNNAVTALLLPTKSVNS